jgi:hypothetical protein
MPKLWLPNVEEVLPENDINYSPVFVPKTLELLPRFLLCLERGDAIISPKAGDPEFTAYIARLSGLGSPAAWLLETSGRSNPYSLVETALSDRALMARLRAMGSKGGWTLEPFIESPRAIRLSRETGIPTDKTHPSLVFNGVITKLNDKGHFKELARDLGVKTPGGRLAESMPALEKAIDLVSEQNNDRVMLRKALYGGGLGNMSGSRAELLSKIYDWYNGGRILIEPFLDITSVAGSLAAITKDGVEFAGVDAQTFCDGKWNGFDFPHHDGAASAEIKRLTLLLAWAVRTTGARGYLNVDWALTSGAPLRPLALECNFRNNGFAYVLDFARRYFKAAPGELFIRYREGMSCGHTGAAALLKRMAKLTVNGRPLLLDRAGLKSGAALTTPPLKGRCSIAVFARSQACIKEATSKLSEAGL